jgi:hypothetical protein
MRSARDGQFWVGTIARIDVDLGMASLAVPVDVQKIKVLASARVGCSKLRAQMRGRSTGNCVFVKKSIFYLNKSYFKLVLQLVVQW